MGAIYATLKLLGDAPPVDRLMSSSLTLGAALIYMLNALNYRPADFRRDITLAETCCWNVYLDNLSPNVLSSDEDEELTPIMLDHGLYFLSGVFLQDNALQMGRGDTIPMNDIQSFYRVYNWQDLNVAFQVKTQAENAYLERRAKLNRIQNCRKVPVDVQLVTGRDELLTDDTPFADQGMVSQISH